ncbi:MAG TPA: fructosamine kinase family protein [Roseiflexaceae bacterium]|nr:fructosamine kinase family protein [Roseiflexaceae bacterium]
MEADPIAAALAGAGDTTPLRSRTPVGGGSISQALRLETTQGAYLLKTGVRGLPGFYRAEARGLELLRAAGAVRIPLVLACRDEEGGAPGLILLEWLEQPSGARRDAAAEALGPALAVLHGSRADAYGLDHDNYIGATPQPNGWSASWLEFFRERRLGFQIERASTAGLLDQARRRALARLLDRLERWIDDRLVQPALLHGDLWSGNMIIGPGGAPALIDPAVSYGDREADLAFTALFGGFPERFYRAYGEAWPLAPGWQERRDLYNLYHLLNHLNLFGPGYLPSVDAVVQKYV